MVYFAGKNSASFSQGKIMLERSALMQRWRQHRDSEPVLFFSFGFFSFWCCNAFSHFCGRELVYSFFWIFANLLKISYHNIYAKVKEEIWKGQQRSKLFLREYALAGPCWFLESAAVLWPWYWEYTISSFPPSAHLWSTSAKVPCF